MITAFIGFFKYLTHDAGRSAAISVAVVLILAASRSLYPQTNIECSAIGGNWCLQLSEKEHMLQYSTDQGWTKSLESDFGRWRLLAYCAATPRAFALAALVERA